MWNILQLSAHSVCAILVVLDLIDSLTTLGKQVIDISLHFVWLLCEAAILTEWFKLVADQVFHVTPHLFVWKTFVAELESFTVDA